LRPSLARRKRAWQAEFHQIPRASGERPDGESRSGSAVTDEQTGSDDHNRVRRLPSPTIAGHLRRPGTTLDSSSANTSQRRAGMAEHVKIFDTTLRDGEQSPGFSLTTPQKVAMAAQLARLGVDVIEAGFPAASADDFAAVQRIAREVRGPIIAGLARAVAADIDQCWEAIRDAERPRIHTFLSSSDIHLAAQFNLERNQAKARAVAMVERARSYTRDVDFSPMDA